MSVDYTKIFVYELRRTAFGWLFPAMLAADGIYAWYVLTTDILAGIAYTAPFSVWSCSAYIGKMMLAAVTTVLLLLAGYYGKKQKQVEILLSAAPVSKAQQMLLRTGVMGVCFAAVFVMQMFLAAVFYARFFQYTDFGVFIIPSVSIAVPCFLFGIGLGHLAGQLHAGAVYLAAFVIFLAGLYAGGSVFDFFGAGYFSAYPLTLEAGNGGEPEFVLEASWAAARILYSIAGAGLLLAGMRGVKRKPTKA